MVWKLKSRFGAVGLHERFAVELRARRRRNNESIAELNSDIKRLMTLAYPESAHSKLGQVIARNHFISALGDRELEFKVRDRDPETLEDAFKAAIRVETHLKAYRNDGEGEARGEGKQKRDGGDDKRRVRQIAEANHSTSEAVKELKERLEKESQEKMKCPRKWGGYKFWSNKPTS